MAIGRGAIGHVRIVACRLPPGRPVIVYCNTGERSAAAAFVLSRLEYEVSAIHGGLAAMLRLQAQQQAMAEAAKG